MTELKTQPSDSSVVDFIMSVEHERRREDALTLLNVFSRVTAQPPVLWGDSMIGFGEYHYKYTSGREGDWFLTGFSPRKQNISLYIMAGFDRYEELMSQLGKYKTGKSCLYINKLADIDVEVLDKLIKLSATYVEEHQSGC